MFLCHHCGREVQPRAKVQRTDSCPFCSSDLKCCLNCRFHDPGANNQCREPQAEWCAEKEKANFCEYFGYRRAAGGAAQSLQSRARATLDDLFSKKK